MTMRVRFWGTRGSIGVSLTAADIRDKLAQALLQASGKTFASFEEAHAYATAELDFSITHTFGGHTPCVEIEPGGDEYFVCDMGSGARPLGVHVLAKQAKKPATVNVFMSHVHWDHIMGFPFFGPAYVPGTKIRIHGCHDGPRARVPAAAGGTLLPVDFSQLAPTSSS
jgi:glyoxylase-like metal-dependent hydrolase (beta-lactamase superfamily II)